MRIVDPEQQARYEATGRLADRVREEIEDEARRAREAHPARHPDCGLGAKSFHHVHDVRQGFRCRITCRRRCHCAFCDTEQRIKDQRRTVAVVARLVPDQGVPDDRVAVGLLSYRTECVHLGPVWGERGRKNALQQIKRAAMASGIDNPGVQWVLLSGGRFAICSEVPFKGSTPTPPHLAAQHMAAYIREAPRMKNTCRFNGRWKKPKKSKEWEEIKVSVSAEQQQEILAAALAHVTPAGGCRDPMDFTDREMVTDFGWRFPDSVPEETIRQVYRGLDEGNLADNQDVDDERFGNAPHAAHGQPRGERPVPDYSTL